MIKSLVQALTLMGAANAVRLNQCCGMQMSCAQPCEESDDPIDSIFGDDLVGGMGVLPPTTVTDIVDTVVEDVTEEETVEDVVEDKIVEMAEENDEETDV